MLSNLHSFAVLVIIISGYQNRHNSIIDNVKTAGDESIGGKTNKKLAYESSKVRFIKHGSSPSQQLSDIHFTG